MSPKENLISDLSLSSRETHAAADASCTNGARPPDPCFFFFLSPEAAKSLPNYQYRGQDLSLIYRYILSPIASFLVHQCTPRSVAPNSITLAGLVWMVASYGFMWYYAPLVLQDDSTEEAEPSVSLPRWIFLFNAIATLVYQTFDNMDGKQARRVGASSPLGLLFDHGCDAVNSLFGSANWMVCASFRNLQNEAVVSVAILLPLHCTGFSCLNPTRSFERIYCTIWTLRSHVC